MHTRVRHMATHTGVRICLCACLCGVVHLSREQGDTHRSAGEGRSPRDAFVPPPLVLPRSHRPAEALMRTRFSVPLSTNALGTTQLRKKAQLCSKRSAERSQDTNSGFWPAENKKEGNARKTRNQVALRAKPPRAQRRQGHCRRQFRTHAPPTVSKERSSMTSMQTTATQRERPLSTKNRRGRMCHCSRCSKINPMPECCSPYKSHSHSKWSF